MSSQSTTSFVPTTSQGLRPSAVVEVCRNMISKATDREPTQVEMVWLVEHVFNRIFPDVRAWRAVTHAWSASPAATKIFSEDMAGPRELLVEKLKKLPAGNICSIDADIPPEQLGTFDKVKGRHLGHVCILLHSQPSGEFYLLDPEPGALESRETGIIFDELIMFTIEAGKLMAGITLDNGASIKYVMYPLVPPPDPSPEILSVLEKCIEYVIVHFAIRDEAFVKSVLSTH